MISMRQRAEGRMVSTLPTLTAIASSVPCMGSGVLTDSGRVSVAVVFVSVGGLRFELTRDCHVLVLFLTGNQPRNPRWVCLKGGVPE